MIQFLSLQILWRLSVSNRYEHLRTKDLPASMASDETAAQEKNLLQVLSGGGGLTHQTAALPFRPPKMFKDGMLFQSVPAPTT